MGEIYFDNAATTKAHHEVAQAAVKMMCEEYGNPSSLHEKGFMADKAVQQARANIADLLGSTIEQICFTSGGTEANNIALMGAANALKRQGKKIITTQIEHSSVLKTLQHLEKEGFLVYYLPPLQNGELDVRNLASLVDDETILVSCALVNSEIGAIATIKDAVKAVKLKNPKTVFHCDAVQAFGKLPFSVSQIGVDLLSVSGHKIHGPKGIGALYIRKNIRIIPIMHGGGQEKGLHPGTENTAGICAFGKAAELASRNMNENFAKVRGLYEYFLNKAKNMPGIRINSTPGGTPYICNISVPGYRSETMLHYFAQNGIYVSSGSACSKGQKSHVLTAMGLPNQRIDSALRISFSALNTTSEIDTFFKVLRQAREDLIRS